MSQVLNTDNSMSLSSWDASSSWADNSLKLSNTSSSNTSTSTHKVDGSYNNSVDSVVTGQAFDFAKGADATLGAGLSSVLSFAKDIATQANEKTSSLASMFGQGVSQAYDSANNTTAGGIDNKTMIVLGVAGAAAVAAIAMNKRG
ncbi:hypothetical protein [Massilia sp. Leaf139]|uniref:hypothetical protein n=1 Tax=Massilia sp. Leaf139 TaxID=1736272 RepID=UPI0006F91A0A|nr:hypothetical protein [Massilia sp. Leaf139]